MKDLLKYIKSLLGKGFATKEEKAEITNKLSALDEEEKSILESEIKQVNALPDEDPDEVDEEEVEKKMKEMIKSATDAVKKETIDIAKKEVSEWIKEQKELMKKQAGVYNPDIKEKRKRLNDYCRQLCKAVVNGDINEVRELNKKAIFDNSAKKEMSTDATGSPYAGYVVDSELSAEIRCLITEYGVARREITTLQLSKNTYKTNELTIDVTVAWADEAGSLLSTQPVIGQNSLELMKLYAIVSLTSELLEDEEIDFTSFITTRVAQGMAYKEDLAFFNGDGTSTYGSFTGLLQSSNVNTVTMTGTTFASMDADDLLDMQDSTPQGAHANGKYYGHRTIRNLIRKLKDSNNQYIYQAPGQNEPAMVWNKPWVDVEAMPDKNDTAADTAFVIFGDLRKGCILGYKGALRIDKFNAGIVRNVANSGDINLITSDREAVRFIERVGYFQVITSLDIPITVLATAAASA